MQIRNIVIRNFRSISNSSLSDCGRLNVLIGKNNAGKSNLLATIELVLGHLSRGTIAGPWRSPRPTDEFTDRTTEQPVEIAIEFDLPSSIKNALCEQLKKDAPQLERTIELIRSSQTITFLVAGAWKEQERQGFLWLSDISTGGIAPGDGRITLTGTRLLHVPDHVALQLFQIFQDQRGLAEDLAVLEKIKDTDRSRLEYFLKDGARRGYMLAEMTGVRAPSGPEARAAFDSILAISKSTEDFTVSIEALVVEMRNRIATLSQKETSTAMSAYAGEVRTAPEYALRLMKEYGEIKLLHLRENKRPIGREEAAALLQLKVKRGGNERLRTVQTTVSALLGVNIDAFEPEDPARADRRSEGRPAELDVDDFLAEANGAGIREALRLILDLELKAPTLALIEEPEVHLHPGLERAMEVYLREKSREVQLFVTTHSTNFVDAVSFRNVYLVSRTSTNRKTFCQPVDSGDGALSIPAELGLRLSTVFMYDRLVFVEGPSDEEVFRELAKRQSIDFARANVGFVQMGGVRNFAHFAAEGTLDLLTRRQVAMWFVTDRDERDDDDVQQMAKRLGSRATLKVLAKRELENYLLDPMAVAAFLNEKAGKHVTDAAGVEVAFGSVASGLRERVVELRAQKRLLGPLYPQSRKTEGTIRERLDAAHQELKRREEAIDKTVLSINEEIDRTFSTRVLDIVSGTQILDGVASQFGLRFRKDGGDSLRLSRHLTTSQIPAELKSLLEEIVRP